MQLCLFIITIPFKVIGYLIPNKNNIWVFGNTFGYKDNAKYLYEYICLSTDYKIRAIWITKDRNTKTIGEHYYYLSFKGLYFQYLCSVVFLTTGMNDLASFTLTKKYIVQLWHGIPIKKILLDSSEISPIPNQFILLNRIFRFLLKKKLKKYNLVCATDKKNQECLTKAFGIDASKVPITGTPRQKIIKDNAIKIKPERKILYAPTWQDSDKKALKWIYYVLTKDFIDFLNKSNIKLDLLIHPLNHKITSEVNLKDINIIKPIDINIVLGEYMLLITDFSSIALDFSLLERPVLFSCYDMDEYIKDRGIYYDYLQILNKSKLDNTQLI